MASEASGSIELKGMPLSDLQALLVGWGEPPFRARQLMQWLYAKRARSIEAMTDLPKRLRDRLSAVANVDSLRVQREQRARDGTLKLLVALRDGETVECVLIPQGKRHTACISTQAGCGMGCTFCATGLGGLRRNLTSGEIVDQVALLAERSGQRVSHVVFMGMGEPLANYTQVMGAIRLLNHPLGFGLGMRHITLSTVGLVPAIRRLAQERLQLVLAVSLHAATDDKRDRIVPINRRYPIGALMEACREYVAATGRRVSFEYALIDGFNDGPEDADALAELAAPLRAHVNLIPLNPVPETGLRRPGPRVIREFASRLRSAHVAVTVRKERGADIEAACGQLRRRSGG
ncbi:MAG TPA: 23S rRNA (adenine(2503)-C(2))-methyltransferase RlmN [Limnochordia bacterium]